MKSWQLSLIGWILLILSIIPTGFYPDYWWIPIAFLILWVGLEKYLERNNEK